MQLCRKVKARSLEDETGMAAEQSRTEQATRDEDVIIGMGNNSSMLGKHCMGKGKTNLCAYTTKKQ